MARSAIYGTFWTVFGHRMDQKRLPLDQDLPQPNGPDTCIGFHEMTTLNFV